MASVPLIQPSTDVGGLPQGPRLDPVDFGRLSTGGARAVAAGLGEIAETASQIAAEQARIKKTLADEQDRVDADKAVNEFKIKAAQNEIDVKNDPALSADQYATQVEERNRRDRDIFGKKLKSDKSRIMYERGADAVQTTATIHARAEGFRTQISGLKVAMDDKRRVLENTAVFGATNEEREAAKLEIQADIDKYLAKGFYEKDEAIAYRNGSRARVQEGEIRRDIRDPEKRIQTMARLDAGGFPALPPEKQLELAQSLYNEDERLRKDRESEARRVYKENYDAAVSDLYRRAGKKELTVEQFDAAVGQWQLTREDQAAISDRMSAASTEAEFPSDRATLDRIEPKVYTMVPRTTETEINSLYASKLLNAKDRLRLITKLNEQQKWHLERGETEIRRQHSQAERELKAALGIPDFFEKLEPKKEATWALAIRELNRRSSAGEGKEDPRKVVDDMIPIYQKMLGRDARVTEEQLLATLKYPNDAELDAAAARGEIKGSDLDNQKRILMELGRVRKDQQFETGVLGPLSRQTQGLGGGGGAKPAPAKRPATTQGTLPMPKAATD